jgi:hypothetical protein
MTVFTTPWLDWRPETSRAPRQCTDKTDKGFLSVLSVCREGCWRNPDGPHR